MNAQKWSTPLFTSHQEDRQTTLRSVRIHLHGRCKALLYYLNYLISSVISHYHMF